MAGVECPVFFPGLRVLLSGRRPSLIRIFLWQYSAAYRDRRGAVKGDTHRTLFTVNDDFDTSIFAALCNYLVRGTKDLGFEPHVDTCGPLHHGNHYLGVLLADSFPT